MATSNANPTPNNAGAPSNNPDDNSKFRIIAIASVIILALIILNVVLFVGMNKNKQSAETFEAKLDETQQLKAELQEQYYDALSELEEMRGTNEELNAVIDAKEEELSQQKKRIERLLANSRSLDQARQEMKKLSAQVDQYLAEINQLKAENEALSSKNTELSSANEQLASNLEMERATNEELSTTQAALVSKNEELEEDRAALSKKVDLASVIKLEDISGYGLKIRSSGKGVAKNRAKNVEQLEVCFNTTENSVAEPGLEEFYVRILNPLGETIAIDELGSGVFTHAESGEKMRYTMIKEVDYDQEASKNCIRWSPGQGFQAGNYEVEIYNKGYLAGTTSFQLK